MQLPDININDWDFRKWFARPALFDKTGGNVHLYVGQKFDPKNFDLVQEGWSHDHCLICFKNISDVKDDQTDDSGYFHNGEWICEACFKSLKMDIEERKYKLYIKFI
jgi:hypothetical protein